MFVKKKENIFDLSKILEGYEGKWVALSIQKDKVVVSGSGNTIDEAIEKAKQRGVDDPIITRVPSEPFCNVV